jgi:hypothetical protein
MVEDPARFGPVDPSVRNLGDNGSSDFNLRALLIREVLDG